MAYSNEDDDKSLLDKLDAIAPIKEFDAFPKVANSYSKHTTLGGVATVLVILLSFLLSLNDIGEFVWGWPDFEYSVDRRLKSTLDINLDMVVNMPCAHLSVDVRDAVGDRLHLSGSIRRDGTMFDARQAHRLSSHGELQSTREIVTAANKKSGGLFAAFHSQSSSYRPTYNHMPAGEACRVYGSFSVKRVTGNLHITSLGHGYSSHDHTDHKLINMTHVISELSFGPYFPNIAQPLDYTYEVAEDPFQLFQYYVTVVPTIYHAARSKPVRTNQYSVNSYRRILQHGRGTPGIFFRFDIDPMEMSVYQRTTSFTQLLLQLCGVIGGVWVCAQWAVKVSAKAVTVVVGKDDDDDQIVNEATLRKKASKRWAGGEIRARTASNPGWTIDGGSPYSTPYSPYPGTPSMSVNGYPATPHTGTASGPITPNLGGVYSPAGPLRQPSNGSASIPVSPSLASPYSPVAPASGPGTPPVVRIKSNLVPQGTKKVD